MIYLASPYSDKDLQVMQDRFEEACRYTAEALAAGKVVYSPIVHCHPMAERYSLPRTWEFWKKIDVEIISKCEELRVLKLPGWTASRGVREEINFAHLNGIKVTYVEPGSLPCLPAIAQRIEPCGTEAEVCDDIAVRQQRGIQKYGTTVASNPLTLRQWLQHAYEECLDQSVYLKRAISEIDSFADTTLGPAKAIAEAPLWEAELSAARRRLDLAYDRVLSADAGTEAEAAAAELEAAIEDYRKRTSTEPVSCTHPSSL